MKPRAQTFWRAHQPSDESPCRLKSPASKWVGADDLPAVALKASVTFVFVVRAVL